MFDEFGPPQNGKKNGKKIVPLHIKRTSAQIRVAPANPLNKGEEKTLEARMILSDFTPDDLRVFATERLPIGQEVSIMLEAPKPFHAKGRIVFLQELSREANIVNENNGYFNIRMTVQFLPESDEQRSEILSYCIELQKECLGANHQSANVPEKPAAVEQKQAA